MKVLHLNDFDVVGGANRAAYLLHQSLQIEQCLSQFSDQLVDLIASPILAPKYRRNQL